MKNSTKVWLFIIITSLSSLLIGYQVADRLGLLIAFIVVVLFFISVYYFGETHLLNKLKAIKCEGQDPWGVNSIIVDITSKLGTSKPHFFYVESDSMFASSTGFSQSRAAIILSTGLIEKLSKEELTAIIWSTVLHIQESDSFVFAVMSSVANSILGVAQKIDHVIRKPIFIKLLAPIAWLFIRSVINSKNYYRNDQKTIQYSGLSQQLAWALLKISNSNLVKPVALPPCSSYHFVCNPQPKKDKNWFLDIHPEINNRIKKITGVYPI